jgi:hypothetical protein
MADSSKWPTFSVRVPDRSRRLARMRANQLGLGVGEYIDRLITADTAELAHLVNSVASGETDSDANSDANTKED